MKLQEKRRSALSFASELNLQISTLNPKFQVLHRADSIYHDQMGSMGQASIYILMRIFI